MSPRRRSGKRIVKALLPIALLILLTLVGGVVWMVYVVTHPPRRAYMVTPESFSNISPRGLKATNETWSNHDGTQTRGWLLRGSEGEPAVVLLHRYGADRSWLFNLGVKLNEQANYTILWPDLRGHGVDPPVAWTSFGVRETDDIVAAFEYLRTLKTAQNRPLLAESSGIYGVQMGALVALRVAVRDPRIRAIGLDAVAESPDDVLRSAVAERIGIDNRLVQGLIRTGVHAYFLERFDNTPACASAASLADRRVLLLGGNDAPQWRESTIRVSKCFTNPSNLDLKTDLTVTGYNVPFVTTEQDEAYDRRVIDFFDTSLRPVSK
jgi:pimeloyl-ACP methyl ester carboxylesterase